MGDQAGGEAPTQMGKWDFTPTGTQKSLRIWTHNVLLKLGPTDTRRLLFCSKYSVFRDRSSELLRERRILTATVTQGKPSVLIRGSKGSDLILLSFSGDVLQLGLLDRSWNLLCLYLLRKQKTIFKLTFSHTDLTTWGRALNVTWTILDEEISVQKRKIGLVMELVLPLVLKFPVISSKNMYSITKMKHRQILPVLYRIDVTQNWFVSDVPGLNPGPVTLPAEHKHCSSLLKPLNLYDWW